MRYDKSYYVNNLISYSETCYLACTLCGESPLCFLISPCFHTPSEHERRCTLTFTKRGSYILGVKVKLLAWDVRWELQRRIEKEFAEAGDHDRKIKGIP